MSSIETPPKAASSSSPASSAAATAPLSGITRYTMPSSSGCPLGPIGGVAREPEELAAPVLAEAERPGADEIDVGGIVLQVGTLVDVARYDIGERRERSGEQLRGDRLRETEDGRPGVRRIDRLEMAEHVAAEILQLAPQLQCRERDVGRAEVAAVMPFHAAAQA